MREVFILCKCAHANIKPPENKADIAKHVGEYLGQPVTIVNLKNADTFKAGQVAAQKAMARCAVRNPDYTCPPDCGLKILAECSLGSFPRYVVQGNPNLVAIV